MGTRFNFKVIAARTVIAMTTTRDLSMEEGLKILEISKQGGATALDRVAMTIERLTGKPPTVEVLSLEEFRRWDEENRDREVDDDREAA